MKRKINEKKVENTTLKAKNAKVKAASISTPEIAAAEPKKRGRKPKVKEDKPLQTEAVTPVNQVSHRKSYWISPDNVLIDHKDKYGNPRMDFGTESEWAAFKQSIKDYGVQVAIKLYKTDDGRFHLAHGYRRMKAVEEINREAGKKLIERIPFDEVPNNEEQILVEHFTLNTGKPLTDVEMAEGLKRLSAITGIEKVAELARRVGMDYQKAFNLMSFVNKASTRVKEAINKGDISFHVGFKIVQKAENQREQIKFLSEGITEAKASGKTKVRTKHIAAVNRGNMPFEVKLGLTLQEAAKSEGVNSEMIETFTKIIDIIKNNENVDKVVELLKVEQHHVIED